MALLPLSTAAFAEFAAERLDSAPAPGRVRLTLPPMIYAVPGIEMNVYYENVALMLNPTNYAFEVSCPKGLQMSERWTYTPEADTAGDFPISITVRDESNKVIAHASSTIRVASTDAGTKRSVTILMIGASFTEYSIYPQHVLDLAQTDDYLDLRFIGSRGPGNMPPTGDLRHEGYSGWTAQAFATLDGPLSRSGYHKRSGTGSPFVFGRSGDAANLDFVRYCEQFNGGDCPDLVTIQVGTNDVFTATDETIEEQIETALRHYDALIAAIHAACPDTRIGATLVTPPSTSQDGFRNYVGTGRQTRWQYRRNHHRLTERMIEHYRDREEENIYLIPTVVNLDTELHFPTWSAARNARSRDMAVRVNNGTHPSPEGYRQIGDSIYCWIKSVIGEY